jgi:hypothetical protein
MASRLNVVHGIRVDPIEKYAVKHPEPTDEDLCLLVENLAQHIQGLKTLGEAVMVYRLKQRIRKVRPARRMHLVRPA